MSEEHTLGDLVTIELREKFADELEKMYELGAAKRLRASNVTHVQVYIIDTGKIFDVPFRSAIWTKGAVQVYAGERPYVMLLGKGSWAAAEEIDDRGDYRWILLIARREDIWR